MQVTWVAMIICILFFEMNLAMALWTGLIVGLAYTGFARAMCALLPLCSRLQCCLKQAVELFALAAECQLSWHFQSLLCSCADLHCLLQVPHSAGCHSARGELLPALQCACLGLTARFAETVAAVQMARDRERAANANADTPQIVVV